MILRPKSALDRINKIFRIDMLILKILLILSKTVARTMRQDQNSS